MAARPGGRDRRPRRLRHAWLRLALCLCALFVAVPAVSYADDIPLDVVPVGAPGYALPEAPADYVRERRGPVLWEYPDQAASVARELQATHRAEWSRILSELLDAEQAGVISGELIIRIGRNPEEMRALAPARAPPPAYASGVAYPHRGLILLTLTAPETWQRPDMSAVLIHELSHIALSRAVEGNEVPRWFSEGVAIYQAREQSLERTRTLWGGTVGDQLLSFERLSRRFPERPHQVNLAYAQSADFVRWLRARPEGERKFRDVIGRIRDGQTFETALERTFSANMTRLQIDWHDDLGERFQALPLLVGSGGLWVFAAFLIVIAYIKRRRRDRDKHVEWEEEEEEERAALASARAMLASRTAATSSGLLQTRDDDDDVLYVVPPEPRFGDPSVPTIEHDGRSHTLH